uniref:UBC core domain-containing protein n=1 Tax=Pseudo-nitzschia australis TaxID=44445 RepID=A0A7S4A9Z4_9STRA|mmetsp:Transcript_7964/g.17117  ORF Transcript_7964/g.17117 Transcript_7964/m.17117 type:complete len:224 (+) Transcript_7964:228-899(+)|eukprot:CAMPEP_0168191484 /NCGR_PEP_ID=MMETSP0139_2-20121125/17543_1 /TAXON_ID=44445 /ORGANISM="Pseudo-nitzschia australis, Strain 10249 10 AB" /LENGTH=223 /DNA_ID=CAMNT_0008114667 /DNA_START=163 /DNA_END=834 /DNA_ORIENTATION=-
MATDICIRRLTKELKSLMKDPIKNPKITVAADDSNILEVHYVIEGLEKTPYAGGFYHGKLLFPKEYPLKPPSVIMMTKNGRFQPNRRLCLSMSDFHPESWNPMWSVSTILTGLYSFMIESAPTLGSVESTKSQKEKLARLSLDYNVRNPAFCKLFPEYVELHRERLAARHSALGISDTDEATMISQESSDRLGANDVVEINGLFATAAGLIAVFSIIFAMRFL